MTRHLAWALGLAVLAGCGNTDQQDAGLNLVTSRLAALISSEEEVPDAREVLTPELLASSDTPVLLAIFLKPDNGFTLIPLQVAGDVIQWRDAANAGMIRRDGILVGTRGYGFDLWSSEVEELRVALRTGGGPDVVRVNRYLNGENQIVRQQFICDVVPEGTQTLSIVGRDMATQLYREVCSGPGGRFENQYWVRGDGRIVRSIEHVSDEIGAVDLTLLVE
ncbi:MAG: YjbF family lipoprotein [Pseudomonadota bacterium]